MNESSHDGVQIMCSIWSEVLKTLVAPDDDFFTLGGDSLSAAEIQLVVEERLGLDVELQDFFLASSPRLLLKQARPTQKPTPDNGR